MGSKLLKIFFGAALILGFVLMKLDSAAVKLGSDFVTAGRGAVDGVSSAAREHGADAWGVAEIVLELQESKREVNEWSVFYQASSKSLKTALQHQNLATWCAIDFRNGSVQATREWDQRLKSLYKIIFSDLVARGVTIPKHADDSNSVDLFVQERVEMGCASYDAQQLVFNGYSQADLDGLLKKYRYAESVHSGYTKVITHRENKILDIAKGLSGANADASPYLSQARSLWVEHFGKPMLKDLQR